MNKQLALSITVSVLAMAAYVLLGGEAHHGALTHDGLRWSVQAETSDLPGLDQLLPVLQ